jgi:glutamate carboxypeptidase
VKKGGAIGVHALCLGELTCIRLNMMRETAPELDWIDGRGERMLDRLQKWCSIHSGVMNRAGLARMAEELAQSFAELGEEPELVDLPAMRMVDADGEMTDKPLGQALSLVKRPNAPRRVLLCIHMDTIHSPDRTLPTPELHGGKLYGPGVADAKGGLLVMRTALEAFEQSPLADQLGWEVLINPDEELGSPGSAGLLKEAAGRNDIGLVFEPTMPDGSLVSARGGSGNYTVVVRGRAAHAGREYEEGRSAVAALAELIGQLEALSEQADGLIVNVGRIEGGVAPNVVADLAIAKFNIRYSEPGHEQWIEDRLHGLIEPINQRDGLKVDLYGGMTAPVKPLDEPTRTLLNHVTACGQEIGLELTARETRGVCDGNRLAAAGLPTLDTLGVRGGGMHTPDEYMLVESLTERAKLTTLLMLRLAGGELDWPTKPGAANEVTN